MNSIQNLFLLIALLFCFEDTVAQLGNCGTTEYVAYLNDVHDGFSEAAEKTYQNALSKSKIYQKSAGEIYRIPVVVHVVYNTEEQNISDAQVQSQIDVLNEDFRRLNADAENTREAFIDVAGDAEVEFYLAEEDPMGFATNGITRTASDVENFGIDLAALVEALEECGVTDINDFDSILENILCIVANLDPDVLAAFTALSSGDYSLLDRVKSTATGGIDPWSTNAYLNIWVCNLGGALLGFAYPPIQAPNWPAGTVPSNFSDVDGVVMHNEVFGRGFQDGTPYVGIADLGRSCTHEVGHYLGLRHIWGDGDCTFDDGIQDTPSMAEQSPNNCEHTRNTCDEGINDLPDMVENYLDYSSDGCKNVFTVEQIGIMHVMLDGPRSELWENDLNVSVEELNFGQIYYANNTLYMQEIPAESILNIISVNGKTIHRIGQLNESTVPLFLDNGLYICTVLNKGKSISLPFVVVNE